MIARINNYAIYIHDDPVDPQYIVYPHDSRHFVQGVPYIVHIRRRSKERDAKLLPRNWTHVKCP